MVGEELAQQIFGQLGKCDGPTETLRYVAVPGHAAVRWLLPAEGNSLAQVFSSWTPYRSISRMVWAAVRAASQLGHLGELPGIKAVEVQQAQGVDWRSLGWRWNGTPIPVIYVGTPGPRQKAVVHLVERDTARCRAVVKVPLARESTAALLHEAEVLAVLESERCESAPRLLHLDRTRGTMTQTFVEGRPGSRQLEHEHWELLRSLLLPGETTTLRVHAVSWERQMDGMPLHGCVRTALDELCNDEPLPACWEHGDFTPWNIRQIGNGRPALLDWEEARRGGLPVCDAFHFLHMQDFLFGKPPQLHAGRIEAEARRMGLTPRVIGGLELAYLVGAYVTSVRRKNDERARFITATLKKFQRKAA